MNARRTIAWLDALSWILIYAGLLMVVLGIATGGASLVAGWSLGVVGGVVSAGGVVLIWVRSRVRDDAAAGAQSPEHSPGGKT